MAEAHESVAEVEDGKDKARRRRFGRRKEEDRRELRSETEWIDTLVAHPEGDDAPLAGSPFAAGEDDQDEPAPAPALPEYPEHEHLHNDPHNLPEEAVPVGDEVVIREKQLYRPHKLALENQVRSAHDHRGERDAFYEKSWTRRQNESMEDIHNYIDNVLGTELEPSRRRERLGRAGFAAGRPRTAADAQAVHVEGLEGDILLAFTFPRQEFRNARVVYETEGGYVVEVTRAVGNDDARLETQFYTVSRVGEVGHVLDKMRAREAEQRARERAAALPPAPEPEPMVAEPAFAPSTLAEATVPETTTEPLPEPMAPDAMAAPEADEGESKRGFGGMFKRKQEATADEPAPEGEPMPADEGGKKKGLGGLFKRKKGDDEAPAPEGEGGTEAENQA